MTREIPVTQARDELADLVNRVAYAGERVILTRHGKPVAVLVSPDDLRALQEGEKAGISVTPNGRHKPDKGRRHALDAVPGFEPSLQSRH
jgi:prevent-host-death family protein